MALVQSAYNATSKQGPGDQGSTSVRATFTQPTTPGSYVLVVVVTAGGLGITHSLSASGYTQLRESDVRDLQITVWGRENAPSISSITANADAYRGMTVRLLELTGIAQASALDRNVSSSGESGSMATGSSGTTSLANETVMAVLANQYASTTQSGYSGGLTKLYEDVTPDNGTQDWERSRTSIHQVVTTATGSYSLSAALSTTRRWIGALITLKGGTTGPAKFSSTMQPPLVVTGGRGNLTVFGPMRSTLQPPLVLAGASIRARIGPSNYQYRLGGWGGLLIGASTDYRVESVQGLEGWDVHTSDADLPRDVGALRGIDLETARQILFKLNYDGTRQQIEDKTAALLRALVPQRDRDWELIYRHPGQPLKSVYCRPINVVRGLDPEQVLLHNQAFTLRAADPRHYAATISKLSIPISPVRDHPNLVAAINVGSDWAFPIIRIDGPTSGAAATRVVVTNVTTAGKFDVVAVLQAGSGLVGDMQARITGAPVSVVTIDGTSKYGAWQSPRTPFALAPGINQLMFEVQPAGVTPVCSLEYRSTWPG